jgi:hypothetical protein
MKVIELIQKLQTFNQEAEVNCYAGYDFEYGEQWQEITEVVEEAVGMNAELLNYEVFLK